MFKLKPNPTFAATVLVSLPEGTGTEKRASLALPLVMRHKTREQLDAWLGKPAAMRAAGTEIDDATYLAEVIEGWGDAVVDEAGQVVPFSEGALRTLLAGYQTASREIYDTYLTALTEAKAKT